MAEKTHESLAGRVLALVAGGQATTRTELGQQLGAPASSVSLAVQQLIARGLVTEEGQQSSTGGRPRKVLRVGHRDEFAVAADLGGHHARIGIVRGGGARERLSTVPLDLAAGPEACLDLLVDEFARLVDATPGKLSAAGLSLPGPVDVEAGCVDSPSRMPGWHRYPIRERLADRLGVTAAIGNDANMMAFGEDAAHQGERQYSITVKAGTAIGAGIMLDGRLYLGAGGAAGDITHVRVLAAGDIPCACGNTGCLETVASGAALQRILRESGRSVSTTEDVVALVESGDPVANQAARQAGSYLGEVLSANVNFFNPDTVLLGGILSTLEPFVAAVRGQLYKGCHPLLTRDLRIEPTSLGADAGLVGAGLQALQQSLAATLESLPRTPVAPVARLRKEVHV
ncbi:ROK family transcriptional regulator [Curtobacterium ammoniigenes]|uniref:ROK family transcriptional regulator n=1 Tax=Curtobacterium ammoniigenes TaxID=395387 RepID=UPI00082BDE5B|nr:ROK family protein [Curtobacterium ammoniigenes]